MLDDLVVHPQDLILILVAFILMLVSGFALRSLLHLRAHLRGRPGFAVTHAITVVAAAVFGGQILALINSVLIADDRAGTIEFRVWIFLASEVLVVGGILYGVRAARRIAGPPSGPSYGRRTSDMLNKRRLDGPRPDPARRVSIGPDKGDAKKEHQG